MESQLGEGPGSGSTPWVRFQNGCLEVPDYNPRPQTHIINLHAICSSILIYIVIYFFNINLFILIGVNYFTRLYWFCHTSTWICHRCYLHCLVNLGILSPGHASQEATVRTEQGKTDWLQIGKGVRQGCILSPCLFNLYSEYIMRNAGLDEAQIGINIAGSNINNLR